MGCISSKQARPPVLGSPPPGFDSSVVNFGEINNNNKNNDVTILDSSSSSSLHHIIHHHRSGQLEKIREESEKEEENSSVKRCQKGFKKGGSIKRAVFSFRFGRLTESEHVAAGWPTWLSSVAGEVVDGWLPLRSDTFQRLDKIGSGTYSNVYRARNVENGKIVALKKVRFDNFQPESVKFMAREITILRRLDHPNIMKLEGIITSRLSCSIYLAFEYMEHDLSGLLSCPSIKFTESQIKCFMRQLLCGLQHCHSRGIMHRDLKTSNILVNNEGTLKIGDFGLANFLNGRSKHQLTSRVVTLSYRPPELLMGSTNYGLTVDLWSVGCVFAELYIGRPLLKGRTEVEQLHKIFKLCGSPSDEYWKHSRLPLATMFKPQQPYDSTLRERCKEFPKTALNLMETFLSLEPYKRTSASSALESEYFSTKPYACDPLSFPKYPPNKDMDAKLREEARRKKLGGAVRATAAAINPRRMRKSLQEPNACSRVVPTEEVDINIQVARRSNGGVHTLRAKGATVSRMSLKPSDTVSEASQMSEESQSDSIRSVPIDKTSSDFAWAKRQKQNVPPRFYDYSTSQRSSRFDPESVLQEDEFLASETQEDDHFSSRDSVDVPKHSKRKNSTLCNRQESFDSSLLMEHQDFFMDYYDDSKPERPKSGPLMYPRIDSSQDTVRRSRFSRDVSGNV